MLAAASPRGKPTTLYAQLQSVPMLISLAATSLARDGWCFYGFKVQTTLHAPPYGIILVDRKLIVRLEYLRSCHQYRSVISPYSALCKNGLYHCIEHAFSNPMHKKGYKHFACQMGPFPVYDHIHVQYASKNFP